MCKRCHAMSERAGVLVFWRSEVKIRRDPNRDAAAVVMVEIAHAIGSTAASRSLKISREDFIAYAMGDRSVPSDLGGRVFDLWLGLDDAS